MNTAENKSASDSGGRDIDYIGGYKIIREYGDENLIDNVSAMIDYYLRLGYTDPKPKSIN